MSQNVSKLESLNGIRGFAILLVLLSHASNDGVFLTKWINFSGAGHYGVFLFFVLSSFLLTRQFLASGKGKILSFAVLQHYFLRRFLRIYPLFIVTLIVYYLLNKIGLLIIPVSEIMIVKSLLLLDAEGIFWTVPVEFQFYFILPFIAYFLTIPKNPVYGIVTGGVFCGIWTYLFPPEYSVNLIPFMPVFVLGTLVANTYVLMEKKLRSHIRAGYKFYDIAALSLMLSFIILVPKIYTSIVPFNLVNVDFQYQFVLFGLLSSGFILCTLLSNGIVRQLMESKFFVFWGKVSFSAYLGHKILLAFVAELGGIPSSIQFLLFFSFTAFFSYLSYQYFERPLAKISIVKKIPLAH